MEIRNYETKSYVIKDFYKSYCSYIGENDVYYVDYKTFRAIIEEYFKYLRDEIIENGKEIKLPCRMGRLSIIKHKPKTYIGKSLRVDYKATKDAGKTIYHLNEHSGYYKYRYYWNKQNMLHPNRYKYRLIMSRTNKRRLAQIIKNKERDYIEI